MADTDYSSRGQTLTNFESRSTLPLNELLDPMSDIFISYSKADHALALKLSAFLESEGWSVWWDRSLGADDLYRDEIMKQLASARAVITIWTENSIKSDWVRAEAGRAKAEGKLIPVKTPELTYADIPLPFGEMHTENLGSTELIRAAIFAQLAKPAVSQSTIWQIASTFKYQVLTWIGIVGSAVTVFGSLSSILNLADWARELIDHWHEWNQIFWGWVFGLVKVNVPREVVPIISFTVFVVILVVGVNLSLWTGRKPDTSQDSPKAMTKVATFGAGLVLYAAGMIMLANATLVTSWLLNVNVERELENINIERDPIGAVFGVVAWIWAIAFPTVYLLYFVKERAWVVVASILFLFMAGCLLVAPFVHFFMPDTIETHSVLLTLRLAVFSGAALLQLCWMAVILFSPIRQLTRRLGFVVLGVITLILLSEISKLNLHQYLQPPKLSDNSLR
jgi:TIR domain